MALTKHILLVFTSMWATLQAETVNVFDLCGNGLRPNRYIKKTENLILKMDDNWPIGEHYCSVRLTGHASGDTLYYQFTSFTVADSSVSVQMTLKSDYGYSTEKVFSSISSPTFTKKKGYNDIVIKLSRDLLSDSDTGLSASLTISNEAGGFGVITLPIGSIIGIVVGLIICIVVVIVLIVYRSKSRRKRQSQAAVVGQGAPAYPVVAYSNNASGPGVYPLQTCNPPAYQPQGIPTVYPSHSAQFAYQPSQFVVPGHSVPSQPLPAYQPPDSRTKPSAPPYST